MPRHLCVLSFCAAIVLGASVDLGGQPFDPSLFGEMRWRMIGPHRGGRTVAAAGIPDQPNVFYIGVNNGGVWKTTDAGATWTHLGLRDGQQIPSIIVDPRNPDRLFVAVLGHPYGPNAERGIFRSLDGGRTFDKVLYRDENTGGMEVAFRPGDPDTIYASLWEARQGPWENAAWTGPGSGLYTSTDGGDTWAPLVNGLPGANAGVGRIGLGMSASEPDRMYAVVGARTLGGLYRSDDAGASWRRVNTDRRINGRDGDFNEVKVDPTDADIVYVGNVAAWKSTDGGVTFTGWRAAPGGDDYHRFWINPNDPDIIIAAADQGAIITVNGGETWEHIADGIPDGGSVNVVREDPVRPGLLYAGTEREVYVSFDAGDHWQSLRLNMPATSIRDLVIKDDDVVVGTHGRSFWILDDVTPLRQLDGDVAAFDAHLFAPQDAWRVRWNMNTDTPLPPEEPAGQNPPDGAIINYSLRAAASGPVTLEILDAASHVVRRYSSEDDPEPLPDDVNFPTSWIRPPRVLSADAGMHRFVWDLHYTPPAVDSVRYPIAAIPGDTPRTPLGPWVLPGEYVAQLDVNGQVLRQRFRVKMDPRVTTPADDLQRQFTWSMQLYAEMNRSAEALREIGALRAQLADRRERVSDAAVAVAIAALDDDVATLQGTGGGFGFATAGGEPSLRLVAAQDASLYRIIQRVDVAPATQVVDEAERLSETLRELLVRWHELRSQGIAALNAALAGAGVPPVSAESR